MKTVSYEFLPKFGNKPISAAIYMLSKRYSTVIMMMMMMMMIVLLLIIIIIVMIIVVIMSLQSLQEHLRYHATVSTKPKRHRSSTSLNFKVHKMSPKTVYTASFVISSSNCSIRVSVSLFLRGVLIKAPAEKSLSTGAEDGSVVFRRRNSCWTDGYCFT